MDYWREQSTQEYKRLVHMAYGYHAVPVISVPSEQVFSKAAEIITKKLNPLSAAKAEHEVLDGSRR